MPDREPDTAKRLERAAQVGVVTLAAGAVFAALWAAQTIAAPVTLALVAGIVLSPLTDRLDRVGLPRSVAALASFSLGIALILVVVFVFQPVATRAIDAFPRIYQELNSSLYVLQAELRGLESVEEEVRRLVDPDGGGAAGDGDGAGEGAADAIPTVEDVVFMAPAIAGQIVVFLGTLFFFILTRRDIYAWAARRLAPADRHAEVEFRLASAERQVSRYFLTISLINLVLGATVALAMTLIGMPSPILWGVVAFLLNFLLYIGPAALVVALAVAGIVVFDGIMAAVPALVYVSLNFTEAQFITPSLLGRRLAVNPLLIFLSLTFFLWLWGPVGAVVAIPLLLWIIVLTADLGSIGKAPGTTVGVEPSTRLAG